MYVWDFEFLRILIVHDPISHRGQKTTNVICSVFPFNYPILDWTIPEPAQLLGGGNLALIFVKLIFLVIWIVPHLTFSRIRLWFNPFFSSTFPLCGPCPFAFNFSSTPLHKKHILLVLECKLWTYIHCLLVILLPAWLTYWHHCRN